MDRHTQIARLNVAIDLVHATLNDIETALHNLPSEDPLSVGIGLTHAIAASAILDLMRARVALSRDTMIPPDHR